MINSIYLSRSYLILSLGMITSLILLISISFKIIVIHNFVFTGTSVLCPAIAAIYLWILRLMPINYQRHILNQALLSLYVFSIGIYLLVNLPAPEYMHDNAAYQIVFEDIPKKFFASTCAFGLSFYLPHLFFSLRQPHFLTSTKALWLAIAGGFLFFSLDFWLLFSEPHAHSFILIYKNSLFITLSILSVVALSFKINIKQSQSQIKKAGISAIPLYFYLVGFSVTIMLICLACEYRLVTFEQWTITASGILFPLTLMASTLIFELYGYKAHIQLVIILVLAELFFDLLLMGMVVLPSPSFFNLNPFYLLILPRRIPAEMLALVVTFLTNGLLLKKLKFSLLINRQSLRILLANSLATSLLCLVNYSILFAGIYPYEQILNLVVTSWLYKLTATIAVLPIVLWTNKQFHQMVYPMRMSTTQEINL